MKKAAPTLYLNVVIENASAVNDLGECLDELDEIHEDNPWHGIGDIAERIRVILQESLCVKEL